MWFKFSQVNGTFLVNLCNTTITKKRFNSEQQF